MYYCTNFKISRNSFKRHNTLKNTFKVLYESGTRNVNNIVRKVYTNCCFVYNWNQASASLLRRTVMSSQERGLTCDVYWIATAAILSSVLGPATGFGDAPSTSKTIFRTGNLREQTLTQRVGVVAIIPRWKADRCRSHALRSRCSFLPARREEVSSWVAIRIYFSAPS